MILHELKKDLKKAGDPQKKIVLQRFFKTGKGEYGEGDIFLGVTVPDSRKIAKKYRGLSLSEVETLLHSTIHEERLVALLILVEKYNQGDEKEKIYRLYLKNTKNINNWDLVDLSAEKIVGRHLIEGEKKILYQLARSKDLWERRIAIMSTYFFIKNNRYDDTLKIAEVLLEDRHDLIHKAVGWMLREVGKRDKKKEVVSVFHKFLPDVIIHTARLSDGSRKIMAISEITGMKDELHIALSDIFVFKQTGVDTQGKVQGYFTATGYKPSFLDEIRVRGVTIPEEIFKPSKP